MRSEAAKKEEETSKSSKRKLTNLFRVPRIDTDAGSEP